MSQAAVATPWRRLSQAHASELDWFYNASDSAMGLRSSFGAQLDAARAKLGRPTHSPDPSEADLQRAMRAARISRSLRLCSTRSQLVLRAYFGAAAFLSRQDQRSLLPLGRMASTMLLTRSLYRWRNARPELAPRGLLHALETLSLGARAGDVGSLVALAKVRLEADELLAVAFTEYEQHGEVTK